MNKCNAILLACVFSSYSQTFLSGEIKGAFPRDNYIISSDLSVKFGDTLSFEAGSELRFKPNTGLTIRGVFLARGKIDNPIILTSSQEQAPRSLVKNIDSIRTWRGIDFSASKVISRLSYCLFCFCDSALVIKNTSQKINIDHVVFHKNKFTNLVWAGKTIETEDDVEYVYQMDTNDNSRKNPTFPFNVATALAHSFKGKWKIASRLTFTAVSLAGAGVWVYGYLKAEDYNRQYLLQRDKDEAQNMREKRDGMVNVVNTGVAMCMIGTGAFFVTFLF
jgi:hypothetical protein